MLIESAKLAAFVAVTDYDKTRAFYEGVLGLRFIKDDGFAMVFESNGTRIRMSKAPNYKPAQFTVLGWEVLEIEQAVQVLQGKGVQFERFGFFEQDKLGIWAAPTGDKVAWFKDPDGNILSLAQHV